jgi:hypothetical protein
MFKDLKKRVAGTSMILAPTSQKFIALRPRYVSLNVGLVHEDGTTLQRPSRRGISRFRQFGLER